MPDNINEKNRKKLAFTISETLIALSIIAVLSTIVITTVFNDRGRQEKINKTLSLTLSHNFDVVYETMLAMEAMQEKV